VYLHSIPPPTTPPDFTRLLSLQSVGARARGANDLPRLGPRAAARRVDERAIKDQSKPTSNRGEAVELALDDGFAATGSDDPLVPTQWRAYVALEPNKPRTPRCRPKLPVVPGVNTKKPTGGIEAGRSNIFREFENRSEPRRTPADMTADVEPGPIHYDWSWSRQQRFRLDRQIRGHGRSGNSCDDRNGRDRP
jgi:hypothetical protein